MARYDKLQGGSFRALLAADWAGALAAPVGVGLDANGRVVPGGGASGVVGVIVVDGQVKADGTRIVSHGAAGDAVDVMTDGEIVDNTGLAAGTVYFGAAGDGAVSTTNTGVRLGHTVEAQRLIVRVAR